MTKFDWNVCGPSRYRCICTCPDGPCDHEWDGPVVGREMPRGGYEETATCAKCGMESIAHSLWVGP